MGFVMEWGSRRNFNLSNSYIMGKKLIILKIICLLFILLFVYAAVNKLLDVDKFARQVGHSPLLEPITWFVVWTIPLVEIVVSIMLTFSKTRLIGLMACFALMILFTVYIAAILSFSEHIPCACGGVLQQLGWVEHLVFNFVFVALAAWGVYLCKLVDREQAVTDVL